MFVLIAIFGLMGIVSCSTVPLYDIEGVLIGPNRFINCDFNSIIHFSSESSELIISYPDPMCQFTIKSIPRGSYLLEVVNTTYAYEPVRIEINSKGKIRARRFNVIQTTLIEPVTYPLRLQPLGLQRFFQQREKFRITDLLANPMVLMLVLPVLMMIMIPKIANDPETKKELNEMHSNFEMPDVSEYLTSITNAGGSPPPPPPAQSKKKN